MIVYCGGGGGSTGCVVHPTCFLALSLTCLHHMPQVSAAAQAQAACTPVACRRRWATAQERTLRGLNLVFFLTTFHFATVGRRTGAGAGGRAKAQDLLVRTTWPMTAPCATWLVYAAASVALTRDTSGGPASRGGLLAEKELSCAAGHLWLHPAAPIG